jgi:hypothetical protein
LELAFLASLRPSTDQGVDPLGGSVMLLILDFFNLVNNFVQAGSKLFQGAGKMGKEELSFSYHALQNILK